MKIDNRVIVLILISIVFVQAAARFKNGLCEKGKSQSPIDFNSALDNLPFFDVERLDALETFAAADLVALPKIQLASLVLRFLFALKFLTACAILLTSLD